MAVVISEDADEEKKFAEEELEITRHRKRMNALDAQGHDIETNFKEHLPDTYDRVLFKAKCSEVFGLIVNYASQGRKWAA